MGLQELYSAGAVHWPGRRGFLSRTDREVNDAFTPLAGLRVVDQELLRLERFASARALNSRRVRFGLLRGQRMEDHLEQLRRYAARTLGAPVGLVDVYYLASLGRGIAWVSSNRVVCGARCRTGLPCRRTAVKGKARCPNHGGLSTGPKGKGKQSATA